MLFHLDSHLFTNLLELPIDLPRPRQRCLHMRKKILRPNALQKLGPRKQLARLVASSAED